VTLEGVKEGSIYIVLMLRASFQDDKPDRGGSRARQKEIKEKNGAAGTVIGRKVKKTLKMTMNSQKWRKRTYPTIPGRLIEKSKKEKRRANATAAVQGSGTSGRPKEYKNRCQRLPDFLKGKQITYVNKRKPVQRVQSRVESEER